MVSHVGRGREEDQLSVQEHAVAGGVSGIVTRACAQPLDVLKIRFQLQVEPIRRQGGGLYHGVLQSMATIVRSEGLTALWKGHLPAQALSFTYGAAQFWSFAVATRVMQEGGGSVSPGLCGAVAGLFGTLTSFPCDVVRTRLVAQGTPKLYMGMVDAMSKMVRQEGLGSLWRGLGPALVMSAPYSGLTFYFYTFFLTVTTRVLQEEGKVQWLTPAWLSGVGAGACAKFCVYPLDVLKKRLQIRGFEEARHQFGKVVKYSNPWKVISQVTQEEGLLAWFKGLWPSLLKAGLTSGVVFFTYEATCHLLILVQPTRGDTPAR